MKKRVIMGLMLLAALATLSGCSGTARSKTVINKNLYGTETFSFGGAVPGEGVKATGSVFVQTEKNDSNATITLHVESAASHPEGISIYAAKGWIITKILSDFPQDGDTAKKFSNAAIVKTASAESEWAYIAEIGCDRNSAPAGGGEGDVIIELTWDYKSVGPKNFKMLASVGNGYPTGTDADGVNAILLEVPLK